MYCSQSHPVATGPMLVWCSDHVVCTYIRGTVEYSRTVFVRMVNESLWLFRSLGAGSRLDDGGLDVGGGRTHLATNRSCAGEAQSTFQHHHVCARVCV